MAKAWPNKDPQEILDYSINWTPKMETGDTLVSVIHTVVSGTVAIESETVALVDGKHTSTVWLSGGTEGETCFINSHVVTTNGREMEQTAKLKIKAK